VELFGLPELTIFYALGLSITMCLFTGTAVGGSYDKNESIAAQAIMKVNTQVISLCAYWVLGWIFHAFA